MSIRLVLLSEKGIAFEGECERFVVSSYKGDMEVSPGYTPIVEMLDKEGLLKVVLPNKTMFFAIFDATLSVTRNGAFIVASNAEEASSIDLARANQAKDRAEKRLSSKQDGIDMVRSKSALNRALIRIKVKRLYNGEKLY